MFRKPISILILLLLALWIGGYSIFIMDVILKVPEHRIKAPLSTLETSDAIIVLTGGNNRIQTGLSLFASGASSNLFITGVNPTVKKDDILSMWKGKTTLPECCIILGHEATTTRENASETKNWINTYNIKKIRLVTSAYHINRALLEFKHKIKGVDIIAHPVKENHNQLQDFHFWRITFTEYNKIMFRTVIIALTS